MTEKITKADEKEMRTLSEIALDDTTYHQHVPKLLDALAAARQMAEALRPEIDRICTCWPESACPMCRALAAFTARVEMEGEG